MRLYDLVRRPIACLALALAMMVGATAVAQRPLDWQNDPAVVLADTEGAIAEIALHYDRSVALALDPVYRDLFAVLPPDIKISILCQSHDAAEEFFDFWGELLAARQLDVIIVGLDISVWARDRCIPRKSLRSGRPAAAFVPSAHIGYRDDQARELFIQSLLHKAHLVPQPLMSWLSLEGGNVVANHRHVFVGAAVYPDNLLAPPQLVEEELRRVVGREYIVVSDESLGVPWEHVDMFLTPADEETVFLASEALAQTLLAPHGEPAELGVGEIDSPLGFCPGDRVQDQLDGIAQSLRNRGYRVLRLPAIFNDAEDWAVNYNNVLMERRGGRRIVYMPIYQIPQLDAVAEAVYASEGFEVYPIDVSRLYRHGGAIRCIANVTRRRSSTGSPPSPTSSEIRVMDIASVDVRRNGRGALPERARASTRSSTPDRS